MAFKEVADYYDLYIKPSVTTVVVDAFDKKNRQPTPREQLTVAAHHLRKTVIEINITCNKLK